MRVKLWLCVLVVICNAVSWSEAQRKSSPKRRLTVNNNVPRRHNPRNRQGPGKLVRNGPKLKPRLTVVQRKEIKMENSKNYFQQVLKSVKNQYEVNSNTKICPDGTTLLAAAPTKNYVLMACRSLQVCNEGILFQNQGKRTSCVYGGPLSFLSGFQQRKIKSQPEKYCSTIATKPQEYDSTMCRTITIKDSSIEKVPVKKLGRDYHKIVANFADAVNFGAFDGAENRRKLREWKRNVKVLSMDKGKTRHQRDVTELNHDEAIAISRRSKRSVGSRILSRKLQAGPFKFDSTKSEYIFPVRNMVNTRIGYKLDLCVLVCRRRRKKNERKTKGEEGLYGLAGLAALAAIGAQNGVASSVITNANTLGTVAVATSSGSQITISETPATGGAAEVETGSANGAESVDAGSRKPEDEIEVEQPKKGGSAGKDPVKSAEKPDTKKKSGSKEETDVKKPDKQEKKSEERKQEQTDNNIAATSAVQVPMDNEDKFESLFV